MTEAVDSDDRLFVGAKKSEDSSLDFSSALQQITRVEADKRIKESRFKQAIQNAEKVNLSEDKLRVLIQTMSMGRDSPIRRSGLLAKEAKELGVAKEKVLSLARNYQKEKIRLREKGDLHHYHQTSFKTLENAAEMQGLMSYDKLKIIGKEPPSSGSRPDVVQVTRDKYDGNGNLHEKGLVEGLSIGAVGFEVALVFNQSIMDLPDYDCLGEYPNLPTIPFDKLTNVLVRNEEDKPRAQNIIDINNLSADVKTRDEWAASAYNQNKSS